jgi:tRNA(adenine34) deaminase
MDDFPIDCPFQKVFPSELNRDDLYFMKLAYNQAINSWKMGEVPIGAIIELAGEVIGVGHNRVESLKDPTAHAEMIAVTQAANHLGDWRMNEATLYVTKEPCPMCSGMSIMARFGRVVYAFSDPKMGGLGGAYNVNELERSNHKTEIVSGVYEKECRELVQAFFQMKRAGDRN